jgi:hypothetical protein
VIERIGDKHLLVFGYDQAVRMVEDCLIGLLILAAKRQNSETREGVDESTRIDFQDLLAFMLTNITVTDSVKRHSKGFVQLGPSRQAGINIGFAARDTLNLGSPSLGTS